MSDKPLIIIGGGLWGGLLAYRLQQLFPELPFLLFEAGKSFGGEHTWSFHESDVSNEALSWLGPFIEKSWPGYTVKFPDYERSFNTNYFSITSERFHQILKENLKPSSYQLGRKIELDQALELSDWIVDARGGFTTSSAGYQNFVGIEFELENPHGLERPVLMDASIEQLDGFRFVYYLPFDKSRVLVEDTYYSLTKEFDAEKINSRIYQIVSDRGWNIKRMIREESGSLPLPMTKVEVDNNPDLISVGGIFHDTTGYSLPDAVRLIESVLSENLDRDSFAHKVSEFRRKRNKGREFYRLLNRFLFEGAIDKDRYKILQFFYRRPESVIRHFYSASLSQLDIFRFFLGLPPIPVFKAIQCLWKQRGSHNE